MADRRLLVGLLLLLGGCAAPPKTLPPPVPVSPPSPKPVVQVRTDPLEEGVRALSEGRTSDARAALQQAVAETPDDPVAAYLLSQVTGDGLARAVTLGGHEDLFSPPSPQPPPAPSPVKRVAIARPSPKVHPAPSIPSPSPSIVRPVSVASPPLPPPPSPSPSPESTLPEDKVMVQGTVTRPDAQGAVGPLSGRQVTLLALGAGMVAQTYTDTTGQFWFEPQEPRYDYYVIVISPMVVQATGAPVMQPVQGPNGTTWLPIEQRVETHHDLSWHQALDLSNPGIYTLTLSADNADPTYCDDVQPTYDAGSRTAFNAFRVGAPSFQPAPQHR